MTTLTDTCPCGASFSVRNISPSNVRIFHRDWLEAHASCRVPHHMETR